MNSVIYTRVCSFVFWLAVAFSILNHFVFHTLPKDTRQLVTKEKPAIIYDNREYLSTIDDVQVSNGYIYILYGELHLVKVFDIKQNYICSIIASGQDDHGARSRMFVKDKTLFLYVETDAYVFIDNAFVKYCSFEEYPALKGEIRRNLNDYRNNYDEQQRRFFRRGVNIYYTEPNGDESVFYHRSFLYTLCSPIFSWALWIIFFSLFVPRELHKQRTQ